MKTTEEMTKEIHSLLFPKKKTPEEREQEIGDQFEAYLNRKKLKRLTKNKNQ